ncbi:MAG: Wzz/FepE/Etk N-terminal domain-containing protein [Pseudomonadota bacterium]
MTQGTVSNLAQRRRDDQLYYPVDDEISLIDIWNVLVKRKIMVLAVLLLSLLGAGIAVIVMTPVYESRAVLQIGQVGQVGQTGQPVTQIEAPAVVVKRLIEQDKGTGNEFLDKKTSSSIKTASVEKDGNLITVVAQASTPAAAQGYLTQVVNKLLREHQRLLDYAQNEKRQYLNLLQLRSYDFTQAIQTLDKNLRALAAKDIALEIILAQEKAKLFEQRGQLEQKQLELRMAMSELQSKPTALIKAPTLPVDPVKPRPAFYLALAAMLGVMLGVFGAFFMEFLGRARATPPSSGGQGA